MDYTQIDIYTTTAGIEAVGALIMELGIAGYEVRDAADFEAFLQGKQGYWDYIDDDLLKLREAETCVSVWLSTDSQGETQLQALLAGMEQLRGLDTGREWGRLECVSRQVREQDWAEAWKQYYHPVRVGKRLVVCPEWESFDPGPEDVVLRMDPGMAFGTGTHESTRLCMQLLEQNLSPGMRMLDIGCGSGILAITAALLGAREATGIDIDEVAVRVATENAQRNNVTEQTAFLQGNLSDRAQGRFDLICMNIVADVIIGFLPDAGKLLTPDGTLLLSGIINERADDVRAVLRQNGLWVCDMMTENGWTAICAAADEQNGVQ